MQATVSVLEQGQPVDVRQRRYAVTEVIHYTPATYFDTFPMPKSQLHLCKTGERYYRNRIDRNK